VEAVAAAAGAAAKAGAAVAQHERLQLLLLRVVSLLGSCVKVMARDQQQRQLLSWGQVASRCSCIAELCLQLAGYEQALVEQRVKSTQIEADKIIAMLDRWCAAEHVSRLSDASMDVVAEMLVQHPYTRQLVWTNLSSLHSVTAVRGGSKPSSRPGCRDCGQRCCCPRSSGNSSSSTSRAVSVP
jgi:hypothetical protein